MRKVLHTLSISVHGLELTAVVFVDHLLDSCAEFCRTGAGLRAAGRIATAMRASPPGGWYLLDEADWKLLRDACEEPSEGYLAIQSQDGKRLELGRLLVPFLDDIANAKEPVKNGQEEVIRAVSGAK